MVLASVLKSQSALAVCAGLPNTHQIKHKQCYFAKLTSCRSSEYHAGQVNIVCIHYTLYSYMELIKYTYNHYKTIKKWR